MEKADVGFAVKVLYRASHLHHFFLGDADVMHGFNFSYIKQLAG